MEFLTSYELEFGATELDDALDWLGQAVGLFASA